MGKTKINASTLIILLCWLVYSISYTGKVNYSANINEVMSFYKVDHSSAGLVSTFFFFAYGIGQVLNGIFCKKYNLKYMVFSSLVISGTINLIVGLTNNFTLIKYLWLINGVSISILWPSVIRLLSETIDSKTMPKASVIIGTTVALGTFLTYLFSALFVNLNFKISFFLPATLFFIVAMIWIFSFTSLTTKAKQEMSEEVLHSTQKVENSNFNKLALTLSICILAFYGITTNLIKDGLTTWIPSILKEQYRLDSSISIILTLALPIVATFGNVFAIKVHSKISDFVLQCALMFLISGIIIGGVIAGIELNSFVITLIGFTIVSFLISSCNSLITSIFPLFMKGKVNSGRIAGVLNGFCYIGSTISSYGLGAIADNFGWIKVFWVLLAVCVVVLIVGAIYLLIKKSINKKCV